MNKILLLSLFAFVAIAAYSADEAAHSEMKKEESPSPTVQKEKPGYIVGAASAQQILRNYVIGEDLDPADVLNGFKDVMLANSKMTEDEIDRSFAAIFQSLDTPQHWKKLNEDYLTANAKKDGVKTTASGLQYKVLVEGKGDSPKTGEAVNAFYRGKYINGFEFDSSYRHGTTAANFPVDKVIAGWTEALQLMKPGAKWKLYVPSKLAYGPAPKNGMRPDSTLVFDIELVDVGPPKVSGPHGNMRNSDLNQQAREVPVTK
jgi:FKBP-type peptidyl-prolyl cis-trans isomerase